MRCTISALGLGLGLGLGLVLAFALVSGAGEAADPAAADPTVFDPSPPPPVSAEKAAELTEQLRRTLADSEFARGVAAELCPIRWEGDFAVVPDGDHYRVDFTGLSLLNLGGVRLLLPHATAELRPRAPVGYLGGSYDVTLLLPEEGTALSKECRPQATVRWTSADVRAIWQPNPAVWTVRETHLRDVETTMIDSKSTLRIREYLRTKDIPEPAASKAAEDSRETHPYFSMSGLQIEHGGTVFASVEKVDFTVDVDIVGGESDADAARAASHLQWIIENFVISKERRQSEFLQELLSFVLDFGGNGIDYHFDFEDIVVGPILPLIPIIRVDRLHAGVGMHGFQEPTSRMDMAFHGDGLSLTPPLTPEARLDPSALGFSITVSGVDNRDLRDWFVRTVKEAEATTPGDRPGSALVIGGEKLDASFRNLLDSMPLHGDIALTTLQAGALTASGTITGMITGTTSGAGTRRPPKDLETRVRIKGLDKAMEDATVLFQRNGLDPVLRFALKLFHILLKEGRLEQDGDGTPVWVYLMTFDEAGTMFINGVPTR